MPKRTGVDATVTNRAVVPGHKRKKHSALKKPNDTTSFVEVMEVGNAREAKNSTLKVLLQFGTTDAIKKKTQKELVAWRLVKPK